MDGECAEERLQGQRAAAEERPRGAVWGCACSPTGRHPRPSSFFLFSVSSAPAQRPGGRETGRAGKGGASPRRQLRRRRWEVPRPEGPRGGGHGHTPPWRERGKTAARRADAALGGRALPGSPTARPGPAEATTRAPRGSREGDGGRRGLQLPACRARRRLRSAAGGGGLFSAEEEQGRGGRQPRVRVQSSAAAARAHDSHMPCGLLHLW